LRRGMPRLPNVPPSSEPSATPSVPPLPRPPANSGSEKRRPSVVVRSAPPAVVPTVVLSPPPPPLLLPLHLLPLLPRLSRLVAGEIVWQPSRLEAESRPPPRLPVLRLRPAQLPLRPLQTERLRRLQRKARRRRREVCSGLAGVHGRLVDEVVARRPRLRLVEAQQGDRGGN
jgi:hypothetical protein